MSRVDTPSLSIVVPTHCRPDLLRACLTSIARHAQSDVETIVVADGCSDDRSRKVAATFGNVRLLELSKRRGFCCAANAGVAAARAPIVELLNDDAEVTAGWMNAALTCFNSPTVAAVAPLVLQYPGLGPNAVIDSAGDAYDRGGFARKVGHGQRLSSKLLRRELVFGASGSSAFIRRAMFLIAGGFPEKFGAYFEDVDLAFRLRRRGGTVVFEPASRVLHRGGSSSGRRDRRFIEGQSCNEERVWWRNHSARELCRSSFRHVAVLSAKAARRWNEGTLLPWSIGRIRAWSEIAQHRRDYGNGL